MERKEFCKKKKKQPESTFCFLKLFMSGHLTEKVGLLNDADFTVCIKEKKWDDLLRLRSYLSINKLK